MNELKLKKLREGAVVPQRATSGSAGLDLSACLEQPLAIPAGGRALIPTGIAIALPGPAYVALLFARSSLGVRRDQRRRRDRQRLPRRNQNRRV